MHTLYTVYATSITTAIAPFIYRPSLPGLVSEAQRHNSTRHPVAPMAGGIEVAEESYVL